MTYTNSLGVAEIGILFEEVAGDGRPIRGWEGDRFALVEGGDGSRGLVWWSVWEDEAARDAFVSRGQAVAAALGRRDPRARDAGQPARGGADGRCGIDGSGREDRGGHMSSGASAMHAVRVSTKGGGGYPVLVSRGLRHAMPELLAEYAPAHRYAVIADSNVARLHGDAPAGRTGRRWSAGGAVHLPRGRAAQDPPELVAPLRRAAGRRIRARRLRGRARGRGDRRPRRLRGRDPAAGHPGGAGADQPDRHGRRIGGREDRRGHPRRQEPDRGVPPAAGGARRSRLPGDAACRGARPGARRGGQARGDPGRGLLRGGRALRRRGAGGRRRRHGGGGAPVGGTEGPRRQRRRTGRGAPATAQLRAHPRARARRRNRATPSRTAPASRSA